MSRSAAIPPAQDAPLKPGERVVVQRWWAGHPGKQWAGEVVENDEGRLLVRAPNGLVHRVLAGACRRSGFQPSPTGRTSSREPEIQNIPGSPAHALEMYWAKHGKK